MLFDRTWAPSDATLSAPLRTRKSYRYGVAAHGDLFAEGVTDAMLDQIFAVMALCPQHVFQVLTKRPERVRRYVLGLDCDGARRINVEDQADAIAKGDQSASMPWPLPNVWLGVSVEDQTRADERIPILLKTPAAIRWVSAEPLLGSVDFTRITWRQNHVPGFGYDALRGAVEPWKSGQTYESNADCANPSLDWIVAGGESGPGARPMHPGWARTIRDQCAAAGVPFLFKQWGEFASAKGQPGHLTIDHVFDDGFQMIRVGKHAAGRQLDGVTHDAFPERPHG